MKIIFDHNNGIFTNKGDSLLEVYAIKEHESSEYMFENGWLPFRKIWYQTKSSRLELDKISKRREKELSKIKVSFSGDLSSLIEKSIKYKKFDPVYLEEYLKLPHFKFFFDDCFCGIVNLIDNIPYYTFMIWDESKKCNSYGTLSYYYLIEEFLKKGHKHLYISEYYTPFFYKKNIQGFEYWDGKKWNKST
jgi:hypothetical protein